MSPLDMSVDEFERFQVGLCERQQFESTSRRSDVNGQPHIQPPVLPGIQPGVPSNGHIVPQSSIPSSNMQSDGTIGHANTLQANVQPMVDERMNRLLAAMPQLVALNTTMPDTASNSECYGSEFYGDA